jgi:hypothetical protein
VQRNSGRLCNQFNNTTSLSDLSLCFLAEPSRAHNQWYFWDTALSENLGVAEGEEIEDGDGVFLGAREIFIALLGWDEGPKLWGREVSTIKINSQPIQAQESAFFVSISTFQLLSIRL